MFAGDIVDFKMSSEVSVNIDYMLHHAELEPVLRSLHDLISSYLSNVSGFLNLLLAARQSQVRNFIYAARSSAYGDHPVLPKCKIVLKQILMILNV